MKKRDLITEAEAKHLNMTIDKLDELHRRLFLGKTAMELGFGGISAVSRATGVARSTIAAGIKDLTTGKLEDIKRLTTRQRRRGAGRKRLIHKHPSLPEWIKDALQDHTPETSDNIFRWTTQSFRRIADTIGDIHGIYVCPSSVSTILNELGYLRHQAGDAPRHLSSAYKRYAEIQFRHIEKQTTQYSHNGDPILSISSTVLKPAENISPSWGSSISDNLDSADGPQSLFGPSSVNEHSETIDSSSHAVASDQEGNQQQIRLLKEAFKQWWISQGSILYPRSSKLLILSDNINKGINCALMEIFLQLSTETGLEIHVSYFPTGISRWNAVVNELCVCAFWTLTNRHLTLSRVCLSSISPFIEHPYELPDENYTNNAMQEILMNYKEGGNEKLCESMKQSNYTILPQ